MATRSDDGGGYGEGEGEGEKEHLRPEGDNAVKMTGGGGEVPSSQSSASYDVGARSAAALATVWKANPSQSHHYTSGLGGVK